MMCMWIKWIPRRSRFAEDRDRALKFVTKHINPFLVGLRIAYKNLLRLLKHIELNMLQWVYTLIIGCGSFKAAILKADQYDPNTVYFQLSGCQ